MGSYSIVVIGDDPYEEIRPFIEHSPSEQPLFVTAIPGKIIRKGRSLDIVRHFPYSRRTSILAEWRQSGGTLISLIEKRFVPNPVGDYGSWIDTSEIGGVYADMQTNPVMMPSPDGNGAYGLKPVNQLRRSRLDFERTDFNMILAVVWHGLWYDTDSFSNTVMEHELAISGFSAAKLIRKVPSSEMLTEMAMH